MVDGYPLILVRNRRGDGKDAATLRPDRQSRTQRSAPLAKVAVEEMIRLFRLDGQFFEDPAEVDPRSGAAGGVPGDPPLRFLSVSRGGDDAIPRCGKIDDRHGFGGCPPGLLAVQEQPGRPLERRFGEDPRSAAQGRGGFRGEFSRQKDLRSRFTARRRVGQKGDFRIQKGLQFSVVGAMEFAQHPAVGSQGADMDILNAGIDQEGGDLLHDVRSSRPGSHSNTADAGRPDIPSGPSSPRRCSRSWCSATSQARPF